MLVVLAELLRRNLRNLLYTRLANHRLLCLFAAQIVFSGILLITDPDIGVRRVQGLVRSVMDTLQQKLKKTFF